MAKIRGSNKNDKLTGTNGNDTILGLDGNDLIKGLMGNDKLSGGAGTDVFLLHAGNKKIDGGSGLDGIVLSSATMGLTFDFTLGVVDYVVDGKAGRATFKNVEAVHATDFDDVITGDDNGNIIHSEGGNDTVFGGGGNDIFEDDDGNDSVDGGDGDDIFVVYNGTDFFNGGAGFDMVDFGASYYALSITVADGYIETHNVDGSTGLLTYADIEGFVGSRHNDEITGNGELNVFFGGNGNDRIFAHGGDDTVYGEGGNDVITGDDGDDVIDGGAGNDTLYGDVGNDRFFVSAGADNIIAWSSSADAIANHDALYFDNAIKGVTADLATSSVSIMTAEGAGTSTYSGIDDLWGSNYADKLSGNNGHNILRGWQGSDVLDGREGDDILAADGGRDTLSGGEGADVFVFSSGPKEGFDAITDFTTGEDELWFDRMFFLVSMSGPATERRGVQAWQFADKEFQVSHNTKAATVDVRIIYEQDTGIIWHDYDGNGRAKAQKVAQLDAGLELTVDDIFVVQGF